MPQILEIDASKIKDNRFKNMRIGEIDRSALKESAKHYGLAALPLVSLEEQEDGTYNVIQHFGTWELIKESSPKTVRCNVYKKGEVRPIAANIAENMGRSDVHWVETMAAIARLVDSAESKGKTNAALAAECGMTRTNYQNYLAAAKSPYAEYLVKRRKDGREIPSLSEVLAVLKSGLSNQAFGRFCDTGEMPGQATEGGDDGGGGDGGGGGEGGEGGGAGATMQKQVATPATILALHEAAYEAFKSAKGTKEEDYYRGVNDALRFLTFKVKTPPVKFEAPKRGRKMKSGDDAAAEAAAKTAN